MTAEEARRLLGVEAGADKQSVRRAYLRLLKTHKPETDPEGFQRLRAAYELLERQSEATWIPAPAILHDTRSEHVDVAADSPPELDTPPSTVAPEPAELPHALTVTPAPSQVFWDRLDALTPYDPSAARRLLEEAIAACPDDPAFYLELASVHEDSQSPAASVEVLRAGAARGHIACAVELLYSRPGALDLETLEQITPRVHFSEAARGFVALGRPVRAFELARDALDPERWSRSAFHHDVSAALDVALGLIADGRQGLGRELARLALAAGRESGAALAAARHSGLRWVLCGELVALDPPLSSDVEAALATSILRDNALSYRFVREELGRHERRSLDERLGREAPTLHQFAGSAGVDPPSFREEVFGDSTKWWLWPLAVFVLHLLRSCTDCGGGGRPVDIERLVSSQRAADRVLVGQGGETPLTDAELERTAAEATAALCAAPASSSCERARFVLLAWQRGDCGALLSPHVPLTATHSEDAGARAVIIFEPGLPPPLAEFVRRCEEEDEEAP